MKKRIQSESRLTSSIKKKTMKRSPALNTSVAFEVIPQRLKDEEKSIFDHANDFRDYIKEAWKSADGIHESIARRVAEFKGEDWEYDKMLYEKLFPWWSYQLEYFPVYVARKNLFSKMDLVQTKEYRAVLTQLEYQTNTMKSQIEKLERTHKKLETRPEVLANPYLAQGKIKWNGTVGQLGHLFLGLEQNGLIHKGGSLYADIAAHFIDKKGKPLNAESLRKDQDKIGVKSKDKVEDLLKDIPAETA